MQKEIFDQPTQISEQSGHHAPNCLSELWESTPHCEFLDLK